MDILNSIINNNFFSVILLILTIIICVFFLFICIRELIVVWKLKRSSDSGNFDSEYMLGFKYLSGVCFIRNINKAIKLINSAAMKGSSVAMYKLGIFYMYGDYLEEDHIRAVYWLRKAFENGEKEAVLCLASLYGLENSPVHDYAKSASWFKKAAYLGYPHAQFMLGLMFRDGIGLECNSASAYAWMIIASESGNELMIYDRDELFDILSEKELETAHRMVGLIKHEMQSGSNSI